MPQMINPHHGLISVLRQFPLDGDHTRVVHQHIESVIFGLKVGSKRSDAIKGPQIQRHQLDVRAAALLLSFAKSRFALD